MMVGVAETTPPGSRALQRPWGWRWRGGESLGSNWNAHVPPPPSDLEHQNFIIASLSIAAFWSGRFKGLPPPRRPAPSIAGAPGSSKQLNGKQPLTRGPGRRRV